MEPKVLKNKQLEMRLQIWRHSARSADVGFTFNVTCGSRGALNGRNKTAPLSNVPGTTELPRSRASRCHCWKVTSGKLAVAMFDLAFVGYQIGPCWRCSGSVAQAAAFLCAVSRTQSTVSHVNSSWARAWRCGNRLPYGGVSLNVCPKLVLPWKHQTV